MKQQQSPPPPHRFIKAFLSHSTWTIALFLTTLSGISQTKNTVDSLMMLYVQDFDTSGLIRVTPNALVPGQFQDMYLAIMGDTLHKFELQKTWTDPQVEMQHYRYQETYRNLRVEAAEYTEHTSDGYLVFSNFKVSTFDLDQSSEPNITEEDALSTVIESLTDHEFAWSDSDWEEDLQNDLNDSTATYYPEGELMYVLVDFHIGNWYIPPSKYRLAWRFDVLSLEPYAHKDYYVDAVTGIIIREQDLICHNGPATTPNHGVQTIDTKPKGNRFILRTDDINDRDIHTKISGPAAGWSAADNVFDDDDDWGTDNQFATATHWMMTQAWDFFASSPYNSPGSNGNGKKVRIRASSGIDGAGYYGTKNLKDYFFMGLIDGQHSGVIDVVGHEFTHAVTRRSSNLIYQAESGALNESFSDIFGFMVERFTEAGTNATFDWQVGEDGNFDPLRTRSLEDPQNWGSHYEFIPPNTTEIEVLGQPNTYDGTFWYNGALDNGGVHVNSGVQNFWFHLLADGGTGTNDNGDPYNIQSIGIDGAALISFWSLTNILSTGSQYVDARAGAIMAAEILWGPCSIFSIQTTNAWAAVGVGAQSACAVTDLEIATDLTPTLFPNPTTDQVSLTFHDARPRSIQVYSVTGSLVEDVNISSVDKFQFSTANLANGAYLVQVIEGNRIFTLKLIKI